MIFRFDHWAIIIGEDLLLMFRNGELFKCWRQIWSETGPGARGTWMQCPNPKVEIIPPQTMKLLLMIFMTHGNWNHAHDCYIAIEHIAMIGWGVFSGLAVATCFAQFLFCLIKSIYIQKVGFLCLLDILENKAQIRYSSRFTNFFKESTLS